MPSVGDSLGRYTLLRKLASGGMGDIFLAARAGPLGFGPPVALKVLREELASDDSFIEMLVDEANISRFLNHQNVVSVLDFGEEEGTYYIAMEFVQGVTLQELLEGAQKIRRKLDIPLALYVSSELCRALKYAHTRKNHAGEPLNIVHRDVTPGNVLLSIQGEVKLTDFGIARARGRSHQTQAGVLKGKFGYMAPEMIRYEQIDARADVFCAGVVMYEMVAGQHPVRGSSVIDAIEAFEDRTIELPSFYNPECPQALDAILMRALEPDPNKRWGTAAELGSALQDLALQNEASRREVGAGASRLSQMIRELNPDVFTNPIPKNVADQLLAEARSKENIARRQLDGEQPTPVVAHGLGGNGSQPAPSFSVRPAGDSGYKEELAEQPTRQALDAISDDILDPATLEPGDSSTLEGLDPRTNERSTASGRRSIPVGDLAADLLDNVTMDGDHEAVSLRGPSQVSTARAQEGLRGDSLERISDSAFSNSDTDRSRTEEAHFDEPELPPQGDATIPLSAVSKEQLEQYMADSRSDLDDKTVAAGMAIPDFGAPQPPPAQPSFPSAPPSRPVFEEAAFTPQATGDDDYDDGATAFTGAPPGMDPLALPNLPGAGLGAYEEGDAPTLIPDVDPPLFAPSAEPEPSPDATLLDQFTAADVARAKQQYAEGQLDLDPASFDDDDDDATRIRPESLIGGDPVAQLRKEHAQQASAPEPVVQRADSEPTAAGVAGARARQLTGPLRIRMGADGIPGLTNSDPVMPAVPPPAGIIAPAQPMTPTSAPPAADDDDDSDGTLIRPEVEDWGDSQIARMVAGRNELPQQPQPAAPQDYNAVEIPPTMPKQPVQPLPQSALAPMPPAAPVAPGVPAQPQLQPLAPMSAVGAGNVAAPPPPMPPRRSVLPLVVAFLVVGAVLSAVGLLLMTDKFWPTMNLRTQPTGASVILDGKPLPVRTPVTVSVKPWVEHTMQFRLEGYAPQNLGPIRANPTDTHDFTVAFIATKHTVSIAPSSGKVFINDKLAGTGTTVELPSDLNDLPGKIEIKVEATGYQTWSKAFAQASEIPASIEVTLQKK